MTRSSALEPQGGRRRLRLLLAGIGSFGAMLGAILLFRRRSPHAPGPQTEDEASGRGEPGTPPSAAAGSAGHETEDMSGGTMMWVLLGLGGVVASSIVLMILLLGYFHRERSTSQPYFTAEQTRTIQPPKPNLQIDPDGDLARLHRNEDLLLDHYAWVDARHDQARIPIQRALTLMVGHRLDTAP